MFRTIALCAVGAYAVEEDLQFDLRMLAQHTNDTNLSNLEETTTTEAISLQVPSELDIGLDNSTKADRKIYFDTLCALDSYIKKYYGGVIAAMKFDGLKASDLTGLKVSVNGCFNAIG